MESRNSSFVCGSIQSCAIRPYGLDPFSDFSYDDVVEKVPTKKQKFHVRKFGFHERGDTSAPWIGNGPGL
jgi:hypothetical protein